MALRRALLVLACLTAMMAASAVASAAPSDGGWAPVEDASIRPGVQTVTEDAGQCTANFVFTDGQGVYLGQSAHCASLEAPTAVNGCQTSSLPEGTRVTVEGASRPGTLVYSSWRTMQDVGESDPNVCLYNDFALVELHPDDHDKVNPTVPAFNGPDGITATGTTAGETVYSYGNSRLRQGLDALSPKRGGSLGTEAGGWNHPVYLLTPGIPGDSGSAVLDENGHALGVLSALQAAPRPVSNDVTDLHRALAYANAHLDPDVKLVTGTVPFDPPLLPVGGTPSASSGDSLQEGREPLDALSVDVGGL